MTIKKYMILFSFSDILCHLIYIHVKQRKYLVYVLIKIQVSDLEVEN